MERTQGSQRSDMVPMRVGDEDVFQLQLILIDDLLNQIGFESGIKKRGFPGDFIPD